MLVKTGVLAPTDHSFNLWVESNSQYPNPQKVRSFADIEPFTYLAKGPHWSRVLNCERIWAEMRRKCRAKFAIVTDAKSEWYRLRRKYEEYAPIWIRFPHEAEKYVYSEVIYGKATPGMKDIVEIMCICEANYVTRIE